jgi:hypothetical protein
MIGILCFALLANLATASYRFTALDIDNHPCKPENLKHTTRDTPYTSFVALDQGILTEEEG